MATPSEVKTGLDAIAAAIATQRTVIAKLINSAGSASTTLASLPTVYAGLIATINAYGTTDAFEALSKAELAKLSTEFTALKANADTIAAVTM